MFDHFPERALDLHFGVGVDIGGRFIEDEDAGFSDDSAREANELALSDAQVASALLQGGIVSALELHDELVRADGLCGGGDLLTGDVGAVVADVVCDGQAGEEVGFLGDDTDLAVEGVEGDVSNVYAVDGDAPFGHIVETQEEGDHGRLACASRPYQGDRMPGRDVEVHAMQDRLAVVVVKGYILVSDIPLQGGEVGGVFLLYDVGGEVEYFEDALSGDHGALQAAVFLREGADGFEEALDVEGERDEHSCFDGSSEDHVAAKEYDERQPQGR